MRALLDEITQAGFDTSGLVVCSDGQVLIPDDRHEQEKLDILALAADKWDAAVLATAAEAKQAEIVGLAEALLAPYGAEYGPTERESWPVQLREAESFQADPDAITPWLDAASAARGMDKADFAGRIITNAAAWSALQGHVNGQRLALQDQLGAILAGEGSDTEKAEAIQAMRVGYELPGL